MRTKRPRKYIYINGHRLRRPITEGYKKFLEATLPIIDPHRDLNIGNISPNKKDED